MKLEIANASLERTAARAHQVVDELANQATQRSAPTIERVAQAAHQTVNTVAEVAAPAADWALQNAAQLKQQRGAFLELCRGYVNERPLAALGFALATGFLIARLS